MQKYPYQITQKLGVYGWNHQALLSSTPNVKVYLGCNLHIPTQFVTIKEFKLNLLNTPDVLKKIQNEITILQQIKSQYLVRVLDLLCTIHRTCIILEYCPDGNLMNYIIKQKRLPEKQAHQILSDIIKGLKELVKMNIFHRNLKPENILISRTPDNNVIFKITDFSFSRLVKNLQEPKNLMNISKNFDISYFSSPQILKNEGFTSKSDLWSIGLIYYYMLFGGLPWLGDTQEQYLDNIQKKPLLFPQNIPISQESQRFLSKTLKIEEDKRISWDQFFEHKLFAKPSQELIKQSSQIAPNLTQESEKFIIFLQNSIYNSKIDIKQLFQQLDKDQNMNLSFDEFVKLLLMVNKNIDQKLAETVFQQFDADKNGTISYCEFKQLILKTNYQPETIKENKAILYQEAEKIAQNIIGMLISVQQSPREILSIYTKDKKIVTREQFYEFLKDFNEMIPLSVAELVFKKFATEEAEAIDFNKMVEHFEEIRKKLHPQQQQQQQKEIKQSQIKEVQNMPGMSEEIKQLINNVKNIIEVQQLDLQQLFSIIDTNSNGTLGFDEVCLFVKTINSKLNEKVIKALFQLMDKNKDGVLQLPEFKSLFEIEKAKDK